MDLSVFLFTPQSKGVLKQASHEQPTSFFCVSKSSYEFHSPINWPLWAFTLILGEWDIVGIVEQILVDLSERKLTLLIVAWTNESRERRRGVGAERERGSAA